MHNLINCAYVIVISYTKFSPNYKPHFVKATCGWHNPLHKYLLHTIFQRKLRITGSATLLLLVAKIISDNLFFQNYSFLNNWKRHYRLKSVTLERNKYTLDTLCHFISINKKQRKFIIHFTTKITKHQHNYHRNIFNVHICSPTVWPGVFVFKKKQWLMWMVHYYWLCYVFERVNDANKSVPLCNDLAEIILLRRYCKSPI